MNNQISNKESNEDIVVVLEEEAKELKTRSVKLLFDGYILHWQENGNNFTYTGFSGQANESAKESEANLGPTPQGLFAIDPARIQNIAPAPGGGEDPDWGRKRVPLEPYRATVDRMINCFGVIRNSMYIHGGNSVGTSGCIELNDDEQHKNFFNRLSALTAKIELEVKYTGARERKYEDPRCPI